MSGIKLTELIDVKILQRMQDAFSEYTGMAALITDEKGVPITKGSGFTELCMNLVRKCKKGSHQCEECDRMGAIRTYEQGVPIVYNCHAGLTDYAAPLMVEDNMVGSIIGGQVRTEPLNEERERTVARSLGIDEETYLEASRRINLVTEAQVHKAAKFLTELAALLSDMAYKNYMALQNSRKLEKMSRSQTNYMVDMYSDLENTLGVWMASAKLSLEKNDPEAMSRSLEVLIKNGREILTAFGNTVEYAKMTDGALALSEATYSLSALVNDVIRIQSEPIKERGNRAAVNISEEVPLGFFGDAGRLKQIIAILVKVANNHTNDGQIEINAREEKADYADMLVVEVKDNGVGMSDSNMTGLNKYMQHASMYLLDYTEKREKELFILRMLVEQLSGALIFEHALEGGVIARLTIPQLEMKSLLDGENSSMK